MGVSRRQFVAGLGAAIGVSCVTAACGDGGDDAGDERPDPSETRGSPGVTGSWRMPAEESRHERTWMCWPSSGEVWGDDLGDVQETIARIALAIAAFEPVSMLARADQLRRVGGLHPRVAALEAPVDDLWARDTLPGLVVRADRQDRGLAGAWTHFNGWGGKQIHDGDARLAELVADHLGIDLIDSGLTGEGGGIEVDGEGTLLATESSWVNDNRNPGRSRQDIEARLLTAFGAERMIWIEGLAGADITDGHIDTLGRFADPTTIVVDKPAFEDPDDPWVAVATRTRAQLSAVRTATGHAYRLIELTQPKHVRRDGAEFLSTYMNYYVCNGAVIAPEFGDRHADDAARQTLQQLFPDRRIVQLDIDALAAGGGGIHCATQQQPATT